jgi:hypothetical protein
MIWGEDQAILACLLYLFVPSVNLITLHTDQVFFPLFIMTSLYLATLGAFKRNFWVLVLTGCVIYLAIFCSFALVGILPFVLGTCYAVACHPQNRRCHWLFLSKMLTSLLIGGMGVDILFRVIFHYDIFLRYQRAMAIHTAFKEGIWDISEILYFAQVNMIEYMVWLGIPLSFLCILGFYRVIKGSFQSDFSLRSLQSLILFFVIFGLAFGGHTKAEVARLWIFLVPCCCILAATEMLNRVKSLQHSFVYVVISLQLGTVYLIKVFQDFF